MGHWLVDTAGIGSIVVLAVGFSVLAAYIYLLRWIQTAPPERLAVTNAFNEEDREDEMGGKGA